MAMTTSQAEKWVITSAAVVGGVYAYRAFTDGTSPPANLQKLVGTEKPLAPFGSFITAWGFMYLVVAIFAQVSPNGGGGMAILIMTADLLANTGSLLSDVQQQSQKKSSSSSLGAAQPGSQKATAQAGTSAAGKAAQQAGQALGGF